MRVPPLRAWLLALLPALLCASVVAAQIEPNDGQADDSADPTSPAVVKKPEGAQSEHAKDVRMLPALALAGPIDAATYRVGPGDVLLLSLWGRVSRRVEIEVSPEGAVVLPTIGLVRVGGRSLADVRKDILRRLASQFNGVEMDLGLLRPRTFRVYRTGMIKEPGPTLASGANRVADVLPTALLSEGASRRGIEVLHADGARDTADLELFLSAGDTSANPSLRDGDVIHVPAATQWVTVSGAVANPGRFEAGAHDRLSTLLALAGGALPEADATRALFLHWRSATQVDSVRLDLSHAIDASADIRVSNGDHLFVYFQPSYRRQFQATVLGEVAHPGTYPIRDGMDHVSDIIAQAGGFLPTADLSALRLQRPDLKDGGKDPELDRLLRMSSRDLTHSEYEKLRTKIAASRDEYRVDWTRLAQDREHLDVVIRDGDMIRVDRVLSAIRVDGEVRRPGILIFHRGFSAEDYIRAAGGYSDRALRSKVRVTRAITGQTLLAKDVTELGPGDFVWVPERSDATLWDRSRDLLTALAQIATVIIAIRTVR